MDPTVQQTLTIIFGTVAPIFLVGGGAFAWLRADIRRVERKSEAAHKDIRSEFKEFRAEVNGEFKAFRTEVNDEFKAFRTEVNGEFKAFRTEVYGEFKAFRAEVNGEFKSAHNEFKDIHSEIGDIKQSQAKMQSEIRCLNDKFDSLDRWLGKPDDR